MPITYKIFAICFLDAVCIGLILPILSTHIFSLQGNHTVLGILGTGHALMQLIAGPLIRSQADLYGKRQILIYTLSTNLLMLLILSSATTCTLVVVIRWIFALTHQTGTLCKAFIEEYDFRENHEYSYNLLNAFTVAGLVIGPIVSGQIYDLDDGFYHTTIMAACLMFLCVLLSRSLPEDEEEDKNKVRTTFAGTVMEDLSHEFKKLKDVNLTKQWDIVMLKLLYHTTITVFFIKFSMLLKVRFKATSTAIGYTYAYQSITAFLSHFIVAIYKDFLELKLHFFIPALIVTSGFIGLCYAPSYGFYLLCFIPMILAHTAIADDWKVLFLMRSFPKHSLEKTDETLGRIVSVVIPVIFGIYCDKYGLYALNGFVLLPLLFAVAILFIMKPSEHL